MLSLKNVSAGYTKGNMILKGIDLEVGDNEVVAIVGQNGSGKSTLAKAIFNLVPFSTGEINFQGMSLKHKSTAEIARQGIGYFRQGNRIFPNLTVEENIAFASAELKSCDIINRKAMVKGYFEFLQSSKRSRIKASYLSGGEQNQLALAMVLMQKPKFLILDEPSAGLSPTNVKRLYETLCRISASEVKSIMIIEQNVRAAISFSNRIILLQAGKIIKKEICENLKSVEKIDDFFFDKN